MIAWLAPGQGAERPGMGREVAAAWPDAPRLLDGLPPGLHDTELVQPAMTAAALVTAAALRLEGVPCHLVAGHSVGELVAWSVAGGLPPEAAVDLARARGAAMAAAARLTPGGMWALDGETPPDPLPPGLVVAAYNPGQVVLSGPGPGPAGASPVPTSGPWHSPAMRAAEAPFREALDAIPPRPLHVPMVSNHDARITWDDATVRAHLVVQLTHPVRWAAVLHALRAAGCTDAVTLGPGKVVAAQLKAACPEIRVHRTDRPVDVLATAVALRRG